MYQEYQRRGQKYKSGEDIKNCKFDENSKPTNSRISTNCRQDKLKKRRKQQNKKQTKKEGHHNPIAKK